MAKGRKAYPWWNAQKRCWYVWQGGERVRLHPDEAEAVRLWHRMEAGLEDGPPQGPTVAQVIDAYLTDAEGRLKASTLTSKRKVLLRLRVDRGEAQALGFPAGQARAWIEAQAGWGQSKRWLAAGIVQTCFRWAAGQGEGEGKLLPVNPVKGLKMDPPHSRGADALMPADAHARLLADAPAGIRDALLALHATGCRPCEICAVEAKHFDAQAGVWILPEHKTARRTGRPRIVYLTPELVTLCRALALAHPTGPMFRNARGNPLKPDRLRNWIFKARRRLGLGKVIAYGYRHGLATDALASGVPDAQVAELLGHSGTAMLHRHYAHLTARSQVLRQGLGRVRGEGQGEKEKS